MRKDIWTESASHEYEKNIEYLLKDWSEKDALNFIEQVDTALYNLKKGIVDYPPTDYGIIRKCVVCKQISMFYQINNNDNIEVLSFWNNYQNEQNNPYQK